MRRCYLIALKNGRQVYQEFERFEHGDPTGAAKLRIILQAVEDGRLTSAGADGVSDVKLVVPMSDEEYSKNPNLCPVCRQPRVIDGEEHGHARACCGCGFTYLELIKCLGYIGPGGTQPPGKPGLGRKTSLYLLVIDDKFATSLTPADDERHLLELATEARKQCRHYPRWVEIVQGVARPRSFEFEWFNEKATARLPEPQLEA